MLVLKRNEGQWIEITHRSGDVLRVRVYGITTGQPSHLNLAFDDAPRHFEIRRPEARLRRLSDTMVDQELAMPDANPNTETIVATVPLTD